MSKKIKNREQLAEKLPLSSPFLVQIFPVYVCNLRCQYCHFALDESDRGFISHHRWMPYAMYQKCIDDLNRFDQPVKMLRFAAIGEPLLHPDIAKMVAYAKKAGVAKSVEIVTNGTLLCQELSDQLIDAGLDRLRISLEGLSDEEYEQHCGTTICFHTLVKELAYFYEQRKNTKVYTKIIDYMVGEEEKRQRFFQLFQPISDEIAVEHLTPTIEDIDYMSFSQDVLLDKPQNEERMIETEICPQPFYMMQINPDGNVVPCCSTKYPLILGNAKESSLYEIWHSVMFREFRRDLLEGNERKNEICQKCKLFLYGMHESDRLDGEKERLKSIYK